MSSVDRILTAALVAVCALFTASCAGLVPVPPAAQARSAPIETSAPNVLTTLKTLAVKGRAPKTGYSRDQFGPAWTDVDHNGCDTRNDILTRDLTAPTYRDAARCVVATGTLADPYTGHTIAFTRGTKTSEAVQIDHLVSLSDAWQTGAQGLTAEQREALANDPLNLLAVDGPTNEAKGDGDTATWLPPNTAARCGYVSLQVQVKAKYGLWVTMAEQATMARVLGGCPDTPAASTGGLSVD